MATIGVVAHSGKTVGGGLEELRAALADGGFADPPWEEVNKSRKAPKAVRRLLDAGVDRLIVWGGDGTVQRCVDAILHAGAGERTTVAVIPAGTANLLATNLHIPTDVRAAAEVALHGARRRIDVGRINGEHFTVMAGTGFDALMISDADRGLKDRLGQAAYLWTGWRNLGNSAAEVNVEVDGRRWYRGRASCVLISNQSTILGGIEAIPGARPDDGLLDVGVITAESRLEWLRVLGRTAIGRAPSSPMVSTTSVASKVRIELDRSLPWELDGGDRDRTRRLKVKVLPGALEVCVPNP
ncbi:MAG: YegS/Rv2252/BmrU family lipid kinase [Acidimicrobiales bacterium]